MRAHSHTQIHAYAHAQTQEPRVRGQQYFSSADDENNVVALSRQPLRLLIHYFKSLQWWGQIHLRYFIAMMLTGDHPVCLTFQVHVNDGSLGRIVHTKRSAWITRQFQQCQACALSEEFWFWVNKKQVTAVGLWRRVVILFTTENTVTVNVVWLRILSWRWIHVSAM